MAIVKIKKWKTGQIGKTYQYDVANEQEFIRILLERDKSKGFYRHIEIMSTCCEIKPAANAKVCINSRDGIQVCDDKDNFKNYKVESASKPQPKKVTKVTLNIDREKELRADKRDEMWDFYKGPIKGHPEYDTVQISRHAREYVLDISNSKTNNFFSTSISADTIDDLVKVANKKLDKYQFSFVVKRH